MLGLFHLHQNQTAQSHGSVQMNSLLMVPMAEYPHGKHLMRQIRTKG